MPLAQWEIDGANSIYNDCLTNGGNHATCLSKTKAAYPEYNMNTPNPQLADPNYWAGWTSVLGGLVGVVGTGVSAFSPQQQQYQQQQQIQQQQSNNTVLWIGGGFFLILLVVLAFVLLRKK